MIGTGIRAKHIAKHILKDGYTSENSADRNDLKIKNHKNQRII